MSRPTVLVALLAFAALAAPSSGAVPSRPNIVYILCDDLGIGDVRAFNPDRCKIATPSMDRLAREGMIFTDAHSAAAVCSPSRYSILTGRYNWRSRLQRGVLHGDSPALLDAGRMTVASLLKSQGYATLALGKWHLGLGFGRDPYRDKILDGPLQHGFDHFFGISASLDMPPFAWIEDDRVTEYPSATKKWMRSGPAAPSFEAVDVLPELTKRATAFIRSRRTEREPSSNPVTPFFLYLALASPHTPLVPSPAWQGKSALGDYGDFVMQTDDAIGQVLAALDDAGLRESTLLFVTSDNGFAPYLGPRQFEDKGHYPSAQFRGYKSDVWEGGHRVPMIARWPGVVAPASRFEQTVEQVDLLATCAAITGATLPDNAGEDSVSMLPALTGAATASPLREAQVFQSAQGFFAIRQGKWKLELCGGSGGWSAPREPVARRQNLPKVQLYDLSTDPAEQHNVHADHPDVVAKLTALLERYVNDGRSTPGKPQKNDVAVDLWKPVAREPRGGAAPGGD
jgi:arylsulfatase A-like enzyme